MSTQETRKESRQVRFHAFINGYGEEEHCVIMALSESAAESRASAMGFYSYSESQAFQSKRSAERWLAIKSIKLELEYVKDSLSRSHRAHPTTIASLHEDQTRLEALMDDELGFVDWETETWDDLDWDESGVDEWLRR